MKRTVSCPGVQPDRRPEQPSVAHILLSHAAGRLDLSRYCALMEEAAEATGNDSFGLALARGSAAARLGLLGEMVRCAATLGDALEMLAAAFPFYQQNTETSFHRTQGQCRFVYRIRDGRILATRQDAEYTMATVLDLMRLCLGRLWAPEEVHFEHPAPAGTEMHRCVFNASVCFGMETNALVFRDRGLERAMPGADPARLEALRSDLARLAGGTGTLSLTDQVLGEIRSRLASGYPHIEEIAEAMGMTRWTLQRRLAEQGRVFSDLVESTRRSLAAIHLAAASLPIQEIAEALGYSELSAFTRACVRWFGKPPSRMRQAILAGKSAPRAAESAEMSIGRRGYTLDCLSHLQGGREA